MNREQKEMEYLRLWMQHAQLFWSRLQTASAIQTGVIAAWYFSLKSDDRGLNAIAIFVPTVGLFLQLAILFIMIRDGEYLATLSSRAGDSFPGFVGSKTPWGRYCGFGIITVCLWIDFFLIGLGCINVGFF